ncbi:TRAP transporter small permease [Aquibium microcysteis]|uniref:TRAP transporter small permease n=1 Tax=Aquibium microcysteis TaxID=675281 RepID=UPI00165D2BD2|nr:TRAP transporter small permease [Aquibium microcysteis]
MSTPNTLVSVLVKGVDWLLVAIGAAGLLAMMLHIGIDILSSLLFNAPLAITSAIVTNYYMIAVAFVPIMIAEYRGAHIGVALVTDALPAVARRRIDFLVQVAMVAVYALLTLQAWGEATDKYAAGAFVVEQTTRILIWPAYFIVPLALGAMALFLALKVILRALGHEPPAAGQYGSELVQDEGKHV